jgi:hypothetical protein
MNVRRTRGSILSWQYASAVSDMAISSSVSRDWAFNGSSQLKGRGVACWA